MPARGHLDGEQRSEVKRRACDAATTEDQSYLAHGREHTHRCPATGSSRWAPLPSTVSSMHDSRIDRFLSAIAEADGFEAMSDAKTVQLDDPEHLVVIEELHEVVGVGVAACHLHDDGSHHWAVETALSPGLRFAAFEDRLLGLAIDLTPHGDAISVWSRRHSLDAALGRAGFGIGRELAHYVVGLPFSGHVGDLPVRTFERRDVNAILAVNRDAFAGHREAASLDEPELWRLLEQEGLGSEGFLIAERDGEIVGFCWTRTHRNRDGEIYRIAVSPGSQKRGLGRSLVLAGFGYLSECRDVHRGTLWVDSDNERAVALYEGLGMTQDLVNREFVQLTAPG